MEHSLKLCVAESHRSRRKAVGDVRLHAFVITYVTASSSSQSFCQPTY